jgi:hypothetical protein
MKITSRDYFCVYQVYIIPRLDTDGVVVLEYRQLHQACAAAGTAYASSAGGRISRAVRGAQEVFSESIEKITLVPVEFQGTVRAPIQIGMHLAVKTNGERGNHFTAP